MQSRRSWCVEGLKIRRFFESLFLGVRVERFNRPFPIACAVARAIPFDDRRDTSGTAFTRVLEARRSRLLFRQFSIAILSFRHSKSVSPQRQSTVYVPCWRRLLDADVDVEAVTADERVRFPNAGGSRNRTPAGEQAWEDRRALRSQKWRRQAGIIMI